MWQRQRDRGDIGKRGGIGECGVSPARNPAGAVYGTVLAGSLIATEGARDELDIPRLLVVVLTTQCVFWVAHVYAELVGRRIELGRRPRGPDVLHLLREEWPLVAASFGPLVVVAGSSLVGLQDNTAVLAGLWTIVAVLASWALLAGRRARMRGVELALSVVVGSAVGVAIILLKVLVH